MCPWLSLFERLTAYCGSHLQIFSGIMYFVIQSPKITNSNSFEFRFSFRSSDRSSCDCSWRSITSPFSDLVPFFYSICTYELPKFLDGVFNFLFQFNILIYSYLVLSYFFFKSFDLVRDNWTIITRSIDRLF